MLPSDVFRNGFKDQSVKTRLSQTESKKVQSNTWSKKYETFGLCGFAEVKQHKTTTEHLCPQIKAQSQNGDRGATVFI